MTDTPASPKNAEEFFNAIAHTLDQILNGKEVAKDKALRRNGFVLLVFPFDKDDTRCTLISNGATPLDIITLMREQIAVLEKQLQ